MDIENHSIEPQGAPDDSAVIHLPEEKMGGFLEGELYRAEQRHNAILSNGLAVLLVLLALEGALAEILFNYLSRLYERMDTYSPLLRLALGHGWEGLVAEQWADVVGVVLRIGPFWLLTLGIVVPLYYFRLRLPLKRARQELADYEEKQQRERLSTAEGRLQYLQEKVRGLSHVTARVFLDNRERYEQARQWREQAEDILDYGVEGNLGEAQSLVSSISELIVREEGELRAQRNWRFANMVIIVGYIVALVAIAAANAGRTDAPVPIFGVPPSILMWGAAGSLAAILYRFYTEERRVRFDVEFRWLIARPVIGIIMGAVVYLAMRAGLLLLGAAPPSGTGGDASASQLGVYWVIAFLAGFSDKFYIGIIDLLVERTMGEQEQETQGQPVEANEPTGKTLQQGSPSVETPKQSSKEGS